MEIVYYMEFVDSRSSIWQGARIGLTVSALYHVAHKMNEFKIDRALREGGYDSDAKADFSESYVIEMINKIRPLRNLANNHRLENIALKIKLDLRESYNNAVSLTASDRTITLFKSVFETNRYLALTIGHELVHRQHHLLGLYGKWGKASGLSEVSALVYSNRISEGYAYLWTARWGGSGAYSIANSFFRQAGELINTNK